MPPSSRSKDKLSKEPGRRVSQEDLCLPPGLPFNPDDGDTALLKYTRERLSVAERFIPETSTHPTYHFENAKCNKTLLLFTVLQPTAFSLYISYSLEFLLFTGTNYILPLLHGAVPVV
jgi:hypothetical protein